MGSPVATYNALLRRSTRSMHEEGVALSYRFHHDTCTLLFTKSQTEPVAPAGPQKVASVHQQQLQMSSPRRQRYLQSRGLIFPQQLAAFLLLSCLVSRWIWSTGGPAVAAGQKSYIHADRFLSLPFVRFRSLFASSPARGRPPPRMLR